MNKLQIFNNSEFGQVRTAIKDNEPMFCLGDLCRALDLTSKGVRQRLSDEVISTYPIEDALGRMQNSLFVNEDGLYDVILESRKDSAKKFRKWVTSEVLPSIRKTGGYIAGQEQMSDDELLAKALLVAQRQIEQRNAQIAEMKPKADFFDAVADSKTAISMNEVAKVLGIKGYGRNNLFEFLRNIGILDRFNVPYQRYVDCGWFRVIEQKYMKNGEPVISTKTLVYQKGVDAIRKKITEKENEK